MAGRWRELVKGEPLKSDDTSFFNEALLSGFPL